MNIEFFKELDGILEKKVNSKDSENSYVSFLSNKGIDAILKKIGEESSEVVMAAKDYFYEENQKNKNNLVHESADLLFHLLVLLKKNNISIGDVSNELEKRNLKK